MATPAEQQEIKATVKSIIQFLNLKYGKKMFHMTHEEIEEIAIESVNAKLKTGTSKHAAVYKVLGSAFKQLGLIQKPLKSIENNNIMPDIEIKKPEAKAPGAKSYKVRSIRRRKP